ncbi:MAG: thymidine kinase [Phycisphaerae bacterium]|nr:thymidine kinase [Phycisphaerae bacterium]
MNTTNSSGRLEVVHGSMFAGKTEYMIRRLHELQAEGRVAIAFKHAIDDRYDADHLVTHTGERFPATRVPTAAAIAGRSRGADVVAIDEGHFFGNALIPVIEQLLARGAVVIVAGLTNDAWGRPFEPMPHLARMADHEELCRAPCRVCGAPAPFTQRMVPVTTPHMVGGLDDYEPRCAAHFQPLPGPPEKR